MNQAVALVVLLNFIFIGLLPIIFFRRDGKLNLMWWLTAAPFVACFASIIASSAGLLAPATGNGTAVSAGMQLLAVPVSVASISLISFTLGGHRVPIALWHQCNDAPLHIVTWGAYSRIRHPFYASFLLAFLAAFLSSPQVVTALSLIWGYLILNHTAHKEEKKLSASEFGGEYREYASRTGRFIPKWG